jgi:hypothetical protein
MESRLKSSPVPAVSLQCTGSRRVLTLTVAPAPASLLSERRGREHNLPGAWLAESSAGRAGSRTVGDDAK